MRLALLTFFICAFYAVFAQSPLPIHLKSGDYFPTPIQNSILKENEGFAILQFKTLPDVEAFFKTTGIKLLDYLPENSFYAALPLNFNIEQLPGEVSGILKITPEMKTDLSSWANRSVNEIKLVYFETAGLSEILRSIEQKGFIVSRYYEMFQTIYVKAKPNYLPLLEIKEIYWAEPAYAKLEAFNLVERSNHRVNVIGDNNRPGKGLSGEGIKIGEWDGGDVGNHEDFNSRLVLVKKKYGVSSHATHVCGTMAGAGNIEPRAKGMAPKAGIYSWDFNDDVTAEMDTNYKKFGYTLTQNSYGYDPAEDPCLLRGNYDATSRELDLMIEKYPNLLHVFAAGNSRGDNCRSGGFKTVLSGFQCAKNAMAVAAVTYLDGDAGFSSCGPTRDGRIKPEVSAVGVDVYSTIQGNIYQGGWSGTSMACPGASGTTALIYEYYKKKYNVLIDAHLAKNFMANSADDIGNPGPDFRYGFGRINARKAIQIIDAKSFQLDSVKQNFTDYDTLKIPKGLHKIKVMLCWNDKAAAITAKGALINDLDLSVIDSLGVVYKPWVLDTVTHNADAKRGRDSLNNIEQVTIDNPPSGRLIIAVKGKRVTTAFQNYSLTWDMVNTGITVTYPNGRESFPPPLGTDAQIIRWDAYNLSGNAKIEYSGDKGASWQTVVSSVAVNQKYFVWNNAADTINTNNALIKITAGSYADQSDTTFIIYKIPSVLLGVICDSQVHFRWPRQNGAIAYKLFQIKNGEMQAIYSGTDTFFTVRPLNNGQAYWFSLSGISKTGGESQRMVAKSFTPNSTIKPPKITLDLWDTAGCKNTNMVLKSTFTGTAAIVSVWQRSLDKGKSWTTLNGRVSDTLLLSKTPFAQNGWKYRRVHYNACEGRVFTKEATVLIDTNTAFFKIPRDTIGCIGADFKLKAYSISSVSTPRFNWYKEYNVIGDPFVYYKKGGDNFLEFKNLTADDDRDVYILARNGCGFSKDINDYQAIDLTVAPKLKISWADFDTICLGKIYTLKPKISGGRIAWYQHNWTGPGINSSKEWITVQPDTSSRYYYKFNDKGCSVDSISDSIDIVVRPKLELYKSNDTTICAGTSLTMKAMAKGGNGKYTFTWNNGLPAKSQQTVLLNKTIVFYITLTDSCSTDKPKDSIVVKVLPYLSLKLNTKSDTICQGQSTVLSAKALGGKNANYKFLWSSSQSDSVITVNPMLTKTYSIVFTDGCTNQTVKDSIKVNVRAALSINVLAPDTACSGIQFNIKANANGGFKPAHKIVWNRFATPGNLKTDTTKIGIWEKATLTDNCTTVPAKDSVWVNVWRLPKIKASADTTLCFGQPDELKFNYTWHKNPVSTWWEFNKAIFKTDTLKIEHEQQGTFNYIALVKDGCQLIHRDTVVVNVLAKLDILPKSIQKCGHQDSLIIFTTSGGKPLNTELSWNDGTKGFSKSFKEKATKIYKVILSDGCSDTAMYSIASIVADFGINNFNIESIIDKTVTIKATIPKQSVDWNLGDGNHSTSTDTSIEKIFTDYSTYTICRKLTDNIGCVNVVCKDVEVIDVMKNDGFVMSILPNPNNGNFNLRFNKIPGNLQLEVFDGIGNLLFSHSSQNYVGTNFPIELGRVAKGIYLLKVTMNGEVITRKIVVE